MTHSEEAKPSPLKGRKQSPEHVAKRVETRRQNGTLSSPALVSHLTSPETRRRSVEGVKRAAERGVFKSRPGRKWTDEQKAAASAKRRQMWAEGRYVDKKPAKRRAVSAMERSLKPYLEALGYRHTEGRQCFIRCEDKTRAPDYVDTEGRRVFEFFGNFWHHPDEEAYVVERYAEKGWACMVLWEEDLREWLDAHQHLVDPKVHRDARRGSRNAKRYAKGNPRVEFRPS